jgi:hypothetical protein
MKIYTAAEVIREAERSAQIMGDIYGKLQSEILTPMVNAKFKSLEEKGLLA